MFKKVSVPVCIATAIGSVVLPAAANTYHLVAPLKSHSTQPPAPAPTPGPVQPETPTPGPVQPEAPIPDDDISVQLSGATLPTAVVGRDYSHTFSDYLQILGDPALDLNQVTWSQGATAFPAWLVLDQTGRITGTPSEVGETPVELSASYKGYTTQASYLLRVQGGAGQAVFSTAGNHNWTVPAGVYSVSVVAVGGGNGAGNVASSSGTSSFNNSLYAYGSKLRNGGGFAGADGGGFGGLGGKGTTYTYFNEEAQRDFTRNRGGGGGGAGGYSGAGGAGGTVGSGSATSNNAAGGGGVGLFGEGASGAGGTGSGNNAGGSGVGGGGGGGASGTNGQAASGTGKGGSAGLNGTWSSTDKNSNPGGAYGGGSGGHGSLNGTYRDGYGGGGLGYKNFMAVTPGAQIPVKVGQGGAVRIIWPGDARHFPSTRTADE